MAEVIIHLLLVKMIFGSFSNTFQTLMIPFNWQQYRLSIGTTAFDVKTNRDQMPCRHFQSFPTRALLAAPTLLRIKGVFLLSLHSFLYLTPQIKSIFFFFFRFCFQLRREKKKLIQNNSVTWALRHLEVNTCQLAFIKLLEFFWEWEKEVRRPGKNHHQTKS